MVSGKTKEVLSVEYVLEKYSEEEIYRTFFGEFKEGVLTRNVLRGDKNPSFIISRKNGRLRHYDFADSRWRGDCFDLVMQMYNCSLQEALKIICSRVKPSYTINVEQKSKERKQIIITFEEKPFNDLELKYWGEIGITVEDLEREGVKVPMKIYRNGIAYNSSTMTFCYTFPSYKGVKLYRPYGMKPSYHVNRSWWKWDCSSDIPFTHVENLDLIHESENLIITKSRKDRMVISKHLGIQSVSTQSENPNSLTPEAAELIKSKCRNVYVLFDNDSQGRSSSKAICEKYGFMEMLIPENVEKDPSEIIRKRGKDEFIKIMLNLLNN